jgi:uncharacterized membrane protein
VRRIIYYTSVDTYVTVSSSNEDVGSSEPPDWSGIDGATSAYADLVAVSVLAWVGAGAVVHPATAGTPVAVALGLPVVLLWPGYAVVAGLYPERDALGGGIEGAAGGFERLVLSVGLSLAASPLVALATNYTLWGVRPTPVFVGLAGVTSLAAVAAALRRRQLPSDRRYRPRLGRAVGRAASAAIPERPLEGLFVGVVVVAVLVSVASVGYLAVTPRHGETFTEFYLLTEDATGEYVASDYPTSFVQGESKPLVVGVTNREHRPVTYTVVVELQRVETPVGTGNATAGTAEVGNGSEAGARVVEETELRRFEDVRLEQGQQWRRRHEVAPNRTGRDLRLTYLLYRDEVPADPTIDNAAREAHLWIDVRADAETAGAGVSVADNRTGAGNGTAPSNATGSVGV